MAQTQAEIQARSDAKRGVKVKSYKLPIATIDLVTALAAASGKPQSAIITEAVQLLAAKGKDQ